MNALKYKADSVFTQTQRGDPVGREFGLPGFVATVRKQTVQIEWYIPKGPIRRTNLLTEVSLRSGMRHTSAHDPKAAMGAPLC